MKELEGAANEYLAKNRVSIYGGVDVIDAFIAGAEWQARQLLKSSPLPEDTLIFRKGVEEGRRLEREDTMTKDEAIYKVLHQRADGLLRLRAERPQDWEGYYEGKFDGYTQAMQLLTETLESICIELEEQEHNDRQE